MTLWVAQAGSSAVWTEDKVTVSQEVFSLLATTYSTTPPHHLLFPQSLKMEAKFFYKCEEDIREKVQSWFWSLVLSDGRTCLSSLEEQDQQNGDGH